MKKILIVLLVIVSCCLFLVGCQPNTQQSSPPTYENSGVEAGKGVDTSYDPKTSAPYQALSTLVNQLKGNHPDLKVTNIICNPDGTFQVNLSGTIVGQNIKDRAISTFLMVNEKGEIKSGSEKADGTTAFKLSDYKGFEGISTKYSQPKDFKETFEKIVSKIENEKRTAEAEARKTEREARAASKAAEEAAKAAEEERLARNQELNKILPIVIIGVVILVIVLLVLFRKKNTPMSSPEEQLKTEYTTISTARKPVGGSAVAEKVNPQDVIPRAPDKELIATSSSTDYSKAISTDIYASDKES